MRSITEVKPELIVAHIKGSGIPVSIREWVSIRYDDNEGNPAYVAGCCPLSHFALQTNVVTNAFYLEDSTAEEVSIRLDIHTDEINGFTSAIDYVDVDKEDFLAELREKGEVDQDAFERGYQQGLIVREALEKEGLL